MNFFWEEINRSERARQAKQLAPALENPDTRFKLLSSLNLSEPINEKESFESEARHFVWILRDYFYFERETAKEEKTWDDFRGKWREILALPEWANEPGWWCHPSGDYRGDKKYIVHPCQKTIGWTEKGILARMERFSLRTESVEAISELVCARKVLNTECDCYIQTPRRILAIECKDKTEFSEEQRNRQEKLRAAIKRLFKPELGIEYIELSGKKSLDPEQLSWTWDDLPELG